MPHGQDLIIHFAKNTLEVNNSEGWIKTMVTTSSVAVLFFDGSSCLAMGQGKPLIEIEMIGITPGPLDA